MSHSLTPEAAIVQGMGGDVVPVTVTEAANRAVVFIDTQYGGKGHFLINDNVTKTRKWSQWVNSDCQHAEGHMVQ